MEIQKVGIFLGGPVGIQKTIIFCEGRGILKKLVTFGRVGGDSTIVYLLRGLGEFEQILSFERAGGHS